MVLPVLLGSMIAGWVGGVFEVALRPAESIEEAVGPEGRGSGETAPDATPPVIRWWRTALPYILLLAGLLYASPLLFHFVRLNRRRRALPWRKAGHFHHTLTSAPKDSLAPLPPGSNWSST